MKASFLKHLLIILCLFAACQNKEGFKNNDLLGNASPQPKQTRAWNKDKLPIAYYIGTSVPEEKIPSLRRAFDLWESATGIDLFIYEGRTDQAINSLDGINAVYWDYDPHPNRYLGLTTSSQDNDTFEILGMDITLYGNPSDFQDLTCPSGKNKCSTTATAYDLTTVLMHEIGHFLGITDTKKPGSLMNPSFGVGDVNHAVEDDLIDLVQSAYGE